MVGEFTSLASVFFGCGPLACSLGGHRLTAEQQEEEEEEEEEVFVKVKISEAQNARISPKSNAKASFFLMHFWRFLQITLF